jgi:hypothetical protein
MKPFPHTPTFLAAAKRIIRFKSPQVALDAPIELMAYAMRHATDVDMALLLAHIGTEGLREAIDNAPPGIVDARSWSYWNAKIGRIPAPPLPRRPLEQAHRLGTAEIAGPHARRSRGSSRERLGD